MNKKEISRTLILLVLLNLYSVLYNLDCNDLKIWIVLKLGFTLKGTFIRTCRDSNSRKNLAKGQVNNAKLKILLG